MTPQAVIKELQKALISVRKCRAAFPPDDEQMFLLLGSMEANAEDAIGALQQQIRSEQFEAAMRGGFVIR